MAEITDKSTGLSCVGEEALVARVVERSTSSLFEGEASIEDEVAAKVSDGEFWMDLSLGWCDSNIVLLGTFRGDLAHGELLYNSFAGSRRMGSFVAKRQ